MRGLLAVFKVACGVAIVAISAADLFVWPALEFESVYIPNLLTAIIAGGSVIIAKVIHFF